jgi:catechol 2,3-dioxygenase
MSTKAIAGVRVSHLVLNVRDLEASHRFYTEALGFEQCGEMTHTLTMRFYRGSADTHHDIALVQSDAPPPAPAEDWSLLATHVGINHIAMAYPNREAWLEQLQHLHSVGVKFLVRGNHGMTHSAYVQDPDGNGIEVLYDLPEEVWGGDVDAALNYFEFLPTDGDAAFDDKTDYQMFGEGHEKAAAVAGRIVARLD